MASSLYTLADLQASTYSRLENNTIFFTLPEVTSIINEAIRCVNLLTGFYQGTQRVLSVANKLVYQTPTGMLYPQTVNFEGIQLDPIPITRIGQDYRTWATDNSNKNGAVARWIPIGINYLCLHPRDSLGGQSIDITGVQETPLLVNSTDAMSLEDQFASLIIEYCASRLPLKIGGANATQAMQIYQKGFVPAIKKLGTVQRFKFPRFFIIPGAPTTEGKIQ